MEETPNPSPYKRDLPETIEPLQENAAAGLFKIFPVTTALVALNVLIYVAMAILSQGRSLTADSESLLRAWGSDFGPLTLNGQYYRLFTNLFLHWDLLHIAFNMYVLWDVGRAVERLYGSNKFFVIYMLAGTAGSLASLLFHPQSDSAGASGAVFGAFGALLVFLKKHESRFEKGAAKAATRSIIVLLLFNLAFGISHAFIDNAAHIGGFVGGILSGLAACPEQVENKRWSTANLVATAVVIAVLYAFWTLDVQVFHSAL